MCIQIFANTCNVLPSDIPRVGSESIAVGGASGPPEWRVHRPQAEEATLRGHDAGWDLSPSSR